MPAAAANPRYRVVLLAALLLLAAAAHAHGDAAQARHQNWVESASKGLDPRAIDTLRHIHGASRELLALRAYLRAGDSLAARWSWSQEQLSRYPSSAEGRAAAADLDAVAGVFAQRNPGYTLEINREPRSLEVQLAHWNDNASVLGVSAALVAFLDRRFAGTAAPAAQALRDALVQWIPDHAAALAAPGLSAHGQGRAFDFAVARGGQVVAGLDAATAHARWDDAGWTARLHAAVVASGKSFVGPLESPYEPWHYAYTPP